MSQQKPPVCQNVTPWATALLPPQQGNIMAKAPQDLPQQGPPALPHPPCPPCTGQVVPRAAPSPSQLSSGTDRVLCPPASHE